jgi:hypothetical protein
MKPSLEQYLWMALAKDAKAECHNLAAAMILMCRILGVRGRLEVGYMYPWPRRHHEYPYEPFSREEHPLGRFTEPIAGAYNERYTLGEGTKKRWDLIFIDFNNKKNAFEGVTLFEDEETARSTLYAIGEGSYDLHMSPHENSSVFFLEHRATSDGKPRAGTVQEIGLLALVRPPRKFREAPNHG